MPVVLTVYTVLIFALLVANWPFCINKFNFDFDFGITQSVRMSSTQAVRSWVVMTVCVGH